MATVTEKYICPVCKLNGRIWVPIWRADVEGWGDELCLCPLCGGRGALGKDEWALRVAQLLAPANREASPSETQRVMDSFIAPTLPPRAKPKRRLPRSTK